MNRTAMVPPVQWLLLLLLASHCTCHQNSILSRRLEKRKENNGNEQGRVIGGNNTIEGRYPYFVLFPGRPCGGSLIAPDLVLTAAHCSDSISTVEIGRYDLSNTDNDFEEFDVLQKVVHPLWNGNLPEYDVMLVQLSGQSVHPTVSLNSDPDFPATEDVLTLVGFDFDVEGEIKADNSVMQEVLVNYIPNNVCGDFEDPILDISIGDVINEQWICADDEDKGICYGDGGNPLIVEDGSSSEDVQVGLAAANYGCNNNLLPDVYVRISVFSDWIFSTACTLSQAPLSEEFGCQPSSAPSVPPTLEPTTQLSTAVPSLTPTVTPVALPTPTPAPVTPQPTTKALTASPVAPPTSTSTPFVQPVGDIIVDVVVSIVFDNFAPEIGWAISRLTTGDIVASAPFGTYPLLTQSVTEVVSLIAGEEHVFVIEDSFGDGLLPPGSYKVIQGSVELVSGGGAFEFDEETTFTALFPNMPNETPSPVATLSPVSSPPATFPTQAPTNLPPVDTLAPVTAPPLATTPSPTESASPTESTEPVEVDVVVSIVFDEFPPEIGWAISRAATGEMVASAPFGTYPLLTETATEVVALIAGEEYVFVIEDDFGDGLSIPRGTYEVLQGDVVLVMGGGDFGFDEETMFTTIFPGMPEETPSPSNAPVATTSSSAPSLPDMPGETASPSHAPVATTSPSVASSPIMPEETASPSHAPTALTSPPVPDSLDMPEETPTSSPATGAPTIENGVSVRFTILFDDFPEEIGWAISSVSTEEIIAYRPIGFYPIDGISFEQTITLIAGESYVFVIEDEQGDGMCCNQWGSYSLTQGDTIIASGQGNFGRERSVQFTVN